MSKTIIERLLEEKLAHLARRKGLPSLFREFEGTEMAESSTRSERSTPESTLVEVFLSRLNTEVVPAIGHVFSREIGGALTVIQSEIREAVTSIQELLERAALRKPISEGGSPTTREEFDQEADTDIEMTVAEIQAQLDRVFGEFRAKPEGTEETQSQGAPEAEKSAELDAQGEGVSSSQQEGEELVAVPDTGAPEDPPTKEEATPPQEDPSATVRDVAVQSTEPVSAKQVAADAPRAPAPSEPSSLTAAAETAEPAEEAEKAIEQQPVPEGSTPEDTSVPDIPASEDETTTKETAMGPETKAPREGREIEEEVGGGSGKQNLGAGQEDKLETLVQSIEEGQERIVRKMEKIETLISERFQDFLKKVETVLEKEPQV